MFDRIRPQCLLMVACYRVNNMPLASLKSLLQGVGLVLSSNDLGGINSLLPDLQFQPLLYLSPSAIYC